MENLELDLKKLRHSAAHVLAQAVKRLYPSAKLAIGPAIKDGFYYDFDCEEKFTDETLKKFEKEMKKIIAESLEIKKFVLEREEAAEFIEGQDEPYKLELLNDIPAGEEISFYQQGDFTDLCAGPHVDNTNKIAAFKLTSVAGAYWRGDEKNKMLQRIYGTAFFTQEDLDSYLSRLEEAKQRDHRKIGRELGLYMLTDEGRGFPFFLPNGMVIRNEIENFWREIHIKNSYREIKTPILLNQDLWHRSGHWDHYKDNMYFTEIDDVLHALKPMNCPGSILVYKHQMHSYREFPIRLGELGIVHRHENSGNLHGLMRVRSFTQDDAHIFMLPEQIKSEIIGVIRLVDEVYTLFGFKYHVELSTRPEDSMGTDEQWNLATQSLVEALNESKLEYKVNEGDGAFYGPKIDFHIEDCIGRSWQCGTIQLDFQMPERFEMEYIDSSNNKRRPVMIHRVIFGSIERFIGILTEHYGGHFPVWISPVQVKILPIVDKFIDYSNEIAQAFREKNIRVEIDDSSVPFGKKIRNAATQKVPYVVIIGENEKSKNVITVKNRDTLQQKSYSIQEFVEKVCHEISSKSSTLNL